MVTNTSDWRAARAAGQPDHRAACRRPADPVASIGDPSVASRHVPTWSKFSSANPIGSMILWHDAHTGFARCGSSRCRSDVTFTSSGSCSRLVSTPGGGDRRRRAEHVLENPLAARHRRRAGGDRRHRQHAALPEQAAPRVVRIERDAAEVAAVNIRNAVVTRQPLVDERVVGVEQVDDAAVLAGRCVQKSISVSRRNAWRRLSSKSGVRSGRSRARAGAATDRRSCSTAPPTADRRASASPAARAPPDSCSVPRFARRRAVRRPGCCSRGRTTAATPARDH